MSKHGVKQWWDELQMGTKLFFPQKGRNQLNHDRVNHISISYLKLWKSCNKSKDIVKLESGNPQGYIIGNAWVSIKMKNVFLHIKIINLDILLLLTIFGCDMDITHYEYTGISLMTRACHHLLHFISIHTSTKIFYYHLKL